MRVNAQEADEGVIEMDDLDCPLLPPTRMRHRADKINAHGGVSALCFTTPRAINMKRATWVMNDDAVTCPKCRDLIFARSKTTPSDTPQE